jgi:xanthine/uracil permease
MAQAALLCSSIAAFLQRQGLAPGQVPLVVGGDFNSIWQKHSSDQWDQVRGWTQGLLFFVMCRFLLVAISSLLSTLCHQLSHSHVATTPVSFHPFS